MRPSVQAAFLGFSRPFEGRVPWMYLDTHEPPLVTVGVGNLIDPMSEATKLPFQWVVNDARATPAQIAVEWTRVKGRKDLAHSHWTVWGKEAALYLSESSINALVMSRLAEDARVLAGRFKSWEIWPADAQLGALSMAWAMGPNFQYPRWELAMMVGDWTACAEECYIPDTHNPGLVPRNAANRTLFGNAEKVATMGMDPGTVWFPKVL